MEGTCELTLKAQAVAHAQAQACAHNMLAGSDTFKHTQMHMHTHINTRTHARTHTNKNKQTHTYTNRHRSIYGQISSDNTFRLLAATQATTA